MRWFTQTCSPDLRLRRARPKEAPQIAELWDRAIARSHGFMDKTRLRNERAALTRTYLPACAVWVAEREALLGFIALRGKTDVAGLFVDPDAQSQGVGRALLNHVRTSAPLHLEVAAPNFAARQFYSRYGFREVARRHDPDLDETLLRMTLYNPMEARF